jgi:hypothetical protein
VCPIGTLRRWLYTEAPGSSQPQDCPILRGDVWQSHLSVTAKLVMLEPPFIRHTLRSRKQGVCESLLSEKENMILAKSPYFVSLIQCNGSKRANRRQALRAFFSSRQSRNSRTSLSHSPPRPLRLYCQDRPRFTPSSQASVMF